LSANSQWQDVISDNLASSGVLVLENNHWLSLRFRLVSLLLPRRIFAAKGSTSSDFQTGEMQFTGDDKDVGIEAKAFSRSNFQRQLAVNARWRISSQCHGQWSPRRLPCCGRKAPDSMDIRQSGSSFHFGGRQCQPGRDIVENEV